MNLWKFGDQKFCIIHGPRGTVKPYICTLDSIICHKGPIQEVNRFYWYFSDSYWEWLAAILDFDTFIEEQDIQNGLLNIYLTNNTWLKVNIIFRWQLEAESWKFFF